MRPIVLASALLLVLSGCAAQEPEVSPLAQTSEAVEAPEAQATQEPAEVGSGQAGQSQESEDMDPENMDPEGQASVEPQPESSVDSQSPATSEPSPTATQEPQPTQEPSQEPTQEPTQEPAPEAEIAGYTLAEVAERNTAAECWVVIDGGVYDLTSWISEHPGGPSRITQLCGTDGTQLFLGMHGGQSRPTSVLNSSYIGPLR